MENIKVYTFGSCRTKYIHEENNGTYSIINRDFFTHSPFEILQILDFFENKKNLDDSLFPKAFNYFNLELEKKLFNEADLVLIEVSSIKNIYDDNNISYNIVYLDTEYHQEHGNQWDWINKKLNNRSLTCLDEVINILREIKNRIKKPIIFQGHVNFPFKTNEIGRSYDKPTYIKNRQFIDDAIKIVSNNYIIYNEIFKLENINLVCQYSNSIINANKNRIKFNHNKIIINNYRTINNINKDDNLRILYLNDKDNKIRIFNENVKINSIIYDELPVVFKFNENNLDLTKLINSDLIHIVDNSEPIIDQNHITKYAHIKLFLKFNELANKILNINN